MMWQMISDGIVPKGHIASLKLANVSVSPECRDRDFGGYEYVTARKILVSA